MYQFLEAPKFDAKKAHNYVTQVSGYPSVAKGETQVRPGILSPGMEVKTSDQLTVDDYRVNLVRNTSAAINAPGYEHGEPFIYVESNPRSNLDGKPVGVKMVFHTPDAEAGSRQVLEIGLYPERGTAAEHLEMVSALLRGNPDMQPVHALGYLNMVQGYRDAFIGNLSPEKQREVDFIKEARNSIFDLKNHYSDFEQKNGFIKELSEITARARGTEASASR